jgi:hypothetical protein
VLHKNWINKWKAKWVVYRKIISKKKFIIGDESIKAKNNVKNGAQLKESSKISKYQLINKSMNLIIFIY